MIKYIIYSLFIVILFTGCNENKSINIETAKINLEAKKIDFEYVNNSSKIAIIFPSQVIGKYAIEATNASMSYLIYKKNNFKLKVFDTHNESPEAIEDVFQKIEQEGISKVLVLLTYNGAKHLKQIKDIEKYNIYLPLIHKNNLDLEISSVVYGSIDYKKQIDKLLKYKPASVVEIHQDTQLGKRLSSNLNYENIVTQYEINNNSKYKKFINNKNKELKGNTLLINIPIVKSSIILSQINANDIDISGILSSQLNYTPLLLSLTQIEDRKNMIIANSIMPVNTIVEEYNSLLDNDIVYNWVNFSSTIGIEYLITNSISDFKLITLKDNQVEYPVHLYTTTKYALTPLN